MSILIGMHAAVFVLGLAGCGQVAEPSTEPVTRPEQDLRAAVERTRSVAAAVDLTARVEIDGVVAAEITTTGRLDRGGQEFDFEIVDRDRVAGVRLVDGEFFQRGPVVADLFPEAGSRWVELPSVATTASVTGFGVIGPTGFAALDLLDDLAEVTSPSAHEYRGLLGEVQLDGGQIGGIDEASFEATVTDGTVATLALALRNDTGVELTFDLGLRDIGAVEPIAVPEETTVYRP